MRAVNVGDSGGYVLLDADICTGASDGAHAQAMWVHRGQVAAVGDPRSVVAIAGEGVPVSSIGGLTILPGMIDAHCHLTWLGYLRSGADCTPGNAPSIEAILDLLASAVPGPDGWVVGSGFAEYELKERRLPTRWDLDAAVPSHPCVLFQTSLHVCVVNSPGLRALGLDDRSEDPVGGRYGRDVRGVLDGRLYEGPMLELIRGNIHRHLDEVGPSGAVDLIERAGMVLAGLGITSCSDASTDAASFAAMRASERSDRLPVRVSTMFTFDEASWLRHAGMTTGFGSSRLRLGAIKIWADGGMSSRTAAVDPPYLEPPGDVGLMLHEPASLEEMIRVCDGAGFQLAVHAQGERAIRAVLEGFASVIEGGNPLRHRIEHGGAFTPEMRTLAAQLGVHVVSQPGFLSELGDGFLEAFGEDRAGYLYPFASLREAGVVVAGSSDAPVVSPSPFMGMRDAVSRRTRSGHPIGTNEAVPVSEALDMYTRRAAFVSHREADLGALMPGMSADFIVVDRSPTTAAPDSLAETLVHRTVVGGRIVHDDGRLPSPSAG